MKSFVEIELLFILAILFVLPPLKTLPIPQKTKGTIIIATRTPANLLFVKPLNFPNMSNSLYIDYIKENLDNNILERILSDLISKDLMSMEYKDLNVKVSDRSLKLNLQNDINFLDDDKNFSRLNMRNFF